MLQQFHLFTGKRLKDSFTILLPFPDNVRKTAQSHYTNVTDRQDRQNRQRSDSIGQTVLQTVAQKCAATISLHKRCTGHTSCTGHTH